MNKKLPQLFKIYLLISLMALPSCAYRPRIVAEKMTLEQIESMKKPAQLMEGEKLSYGITWVGIPCGRMDMQIKGIEKIGGREYYRIVCEAGPNNFFSIFFKSKYLLETYLDTESGLPLKSSRKKLPKGEAEEDIIFDRNNKIAEINNGKTVKKIELSQNSHDLLSFLYYFRMHGLGPDKKYNLDIIYGGRSWPVEISTGGVGQLKLHGSECLQVLSVKVSSGLMLEIMGGNEMEAYVTIDSKRIPAFFSVKTKMGQADTSLIKKEICSY